MNNRSIFCIIVTYNAIKLIDKCLGSLNSSSVKVRTVIIDNCSKDETVTYIKKNYPEVHLIVNDKNRGFGQANNQGIEYAYKHGATHFFLLNQDVWGYEDAIEKLVEVQDKYNIALVSPIHLNGNGDLLDYGFFNKIVIDEKNREFVSDLILDEIKPYYTVFNINAAAWMISRKTIERVGGFDPIYFHYGEDGNYSQRVKYHKGDVAFVPDSYMHHDRDKHGNAKVYKKNVTIMMLLFIYSDINSNVWKITKDKILIHLVSAKLAFSFLFKFNFKDFWNLCDSYFTFFVKFPKMLKSMKLNKEIGPTWLNLY
ncbi:MAG: glycosyltransferase family 2 protein [Erysipelotrichales bacterium]|nr:glycosyltransferase family 2 protein [Erysipelotrichales bacterium]